MTEKTFVLLKPDSVQRAICGDIISRFERATLKIIALKMVYADEDIAGTRSQRGKCIVFKPVGMFRGTVGAQKGISQIESRHLWR